MNLSTYLQMPPAPPAAQGTSTQAAQGAAGLAGQAAGASLGFDFAQVMAKQMVRFNPQQRQEFAASPAANATHSSYQSEHEALNTRADRTPSPSVSDLASPSSEQDREDEDDRSNTTRGQAPRRTAKPQRTDTATSTDPLASVMAQIAAVTSAADAPVSDATATPTNALPVGESPATAAIAVTAQEATQANAESAAPQDALSQMAAQLRTVELSPRMRIVTDPKQAPNPESLAAFAKSMGLDEQAVQSLMGQSAPNGALPQTGTSAANTPAANLMAGVGAHQGQGHVDSTGLQALTSATLQTAQISVTAAADATPAPVMTTVTPTTAELNHGSLLPAMSPADMASIQQLQVTVLPAAVALPANGHASLTGATTHDASTDSVSLLGGPLLEQDIAELASGFTDSGSDMSSDTSSSDSGQTGFGFAQTMASAHADKASLSKTTPTTAAQSMSDTYDQLSDKLSTEMAARIHKQLSEGQWKMKFGLRPENLGGVEIQLEMKDGKLDAVFRADNPLTRDLLQNSSQRLRDALENFGIQAGLVHVGQDGGAAQQRQSGHANNPGQFGHNSGSPLSNDADVPTNTDNVRNKANASLLDLYA